MSPPASAAVKVLEDKEEAMNGRPVTSSSCDAQTCPWKPYSNSQDFTKDAWLIVAILLFLLLLAISLNSLVRCLIRRRRRPSPPHPVDMSSPTTKPPSSGDGCSVVLFSAAEENRDCAICLSEFEEGESVKVLDGCQHGFHVHCIKEWLSAPHSSCPICRASISIKSCLV